MHALIASWQDVSAGSQQLEPGAVGIQLLAAALYTNPVPHVIPPWPDTRPRSPTSPIHTLNILLHMVSIFAIGEQWGAQLWQSQVTGVLFM